MLIAKLEEVGRHVPLSAEKLSPILAFYSVGESRRRDRRLHAIAEIWRVRAHLPRFTRKIKMRCANLVLRFLLSASA